MVELCIKENDYSQLNSHFVRLCFRFQTWIMRWFYKNDIIAQCYLFLIELKYFLFKKYHLIMCEVV